MPTRLPGWISSRSCFIIASGYFRFSPPPVILARYTAASCLQQHPIKPVSSHAFHVDAFRLSSAAVCASSHLSAYNVSIYSQSAKFPWNSNHWVTYSFSQSIMLLLLLNMSVHSCNGFGCNELAWGQKGLIIPTSSGVMSLLKIPIKTYNQWLVSRFVWIG